MNRLLPLALVFLVTLSAGAADQFARDPEQISIATTGRIVKIDTRNKTLKVRASDASSLSIRGLSQNFSQMMQGLKHIGVTLPGGITISLPGRTRSVQKATDPKETNPDEYTVVTTDDTVYQDGSDTLRFEDFKNGEVISVHGVLNGSTLTASRIAKWF
jgi:archaeosine-15-forming tRNA-guanine transglycosylase